MSLLKFLYFYFVEFGIVHVGQFWRAVLRIIVSIADGKWCIIESNMVKNGMTHIILFADGVKAK